MAIVLDDVLDSNLPEEVDPLEVVVGDPPEEDSLPEKYRNKSVQDVIAMHQEAEKFIGKQGGEVGDLRKVVDDFIKTQTSSNLKTQEPEEEDDEGEFFVNPKSTVDKAISNHPDIIAARKSVSDSKRNDTLSKLKSNHPNYEDVVMDPDFRVWIQKSKIRSELYNRAELQFDYDSADEILSNWKKEKPTAVVTDTTKQERDRVLKQADVGSSTSSERVSKKKYRRSDIIKLMQTDPTAYEARADEILLAYAEGRVI
jgi:hypothetical protein